MGLDRRALPGLFGGLAGFAFGVVGALTANTTVIVLASCCALVAAATTVALSEHVRRADKHAAVHAVELAALKEREAQARANADSLVDPETGLPDIRFFELALESRISAARRHLWPVAVVLLEVTPQPDHHLSDTTEAFTQLVRETLREADVVCRTGSRTFALVLEDTNEAGGVWAAERLQVATAKDDIGARHLVAGVAAYPTHGLDADDVLDRARSALARAAAADPGRGLGPVEVAISEVS